MGQSTFVPLLFDREYTCLTMSSVHTSLIDYRFRLLPQFSFPSGGQAMGQITSKKTSKKAQKDIAAQGFENIDMPGNIHALMEEED